MTPAPLKLVHNVPHAAPWGLLVAQYSYFAGVSAGAFVVSALWTVFGVDRYRPLAKPAAMASLVLIAAASLCLLADLEQPLRFWLLFTSFEPRSTVSWGAWLLAAYLLACVANVCLLCSSHRQASKTLGAGGTVLGLCLSGCAGLGLTTAGARAFWNGHLLPPYSIVSALTCGSALMIVYAASRKRLSRDDEYAGAGIAGLAQYLHGALALSLVLTIGHLAILASRGGDPRLAALLAVRDPLFGIGVLAGHLVPFLLLCSPAGSRSSRWATVASLLTLAGALCARYAILAIGQAIPLS